MKFNAIGQYILVVCPNPSVDIYAWVKNFEEGTSNRLQKEEHFPGGKGVHVAMAAAELGEEVRLLGFWGGPTGNWIKSTCEKLYPNLKCIGLEVEGWSRSCYTFKSEGDFDDTELLGVGPVPSMKDVEEFYEIFEKNIEEAQCVCMSGSWPGGSPDDGYAQLIKRANRFNKSTFLDCTGKQFENAIKLHPHTIHLNRSEITALLKISDFQEATAMLVNQCEYAAVTDGAKGLYLTSKNLVLHASCIIEKDKVYSAVGSGDCLTAGLVVAYTRGLNIEESAKLGVATGAANCLRKDLGMLYCKDVEQLFKKAMVVQVKSPAYKNE
jgi:tagatose 6-phosphate kinase